MSAAFVRVGALSDLSPGKMKCVKAGDRCLLIANVDGTVYAMDDTCSHEDASLSTGSLRGEFVKCPLHGSRFNVRTGCAMDEPADTDLKSYQVRIVGDDILVEEGKEAG